MVQMVKRRPAGASARQPSVSQQHGVWVAATRVWLTVPLCRRLAFLPARRYASVVFATATCLSVCLSVTIFDLPRQSWTLLNRIWTDQGPCRANLRKWGLAASEFCDCSQQQTMGHVDSCPLTQLDGGLTSLHKADWWRSHVAENHGGNSTRQIINNLSVCPSVCLSHVGIVPSRAKAGSWNVHHLIAPWF